MHTALSSEPLCCSIMETCRNWEQILETAWQLGWGSVGARTATDLIMWKTKHSFQRVHDIWLQGHTEFCCVCTAGASGQSWQLLYGMEVVQNQGCTESYGGCFNSRGNACMSRQKRTKAATVQSNALLQPLHWNPSQSQGLAQVPWTRTGPWLTSKTSFTALTGILSGWQTSLYSQSREPHTS